MVDVTTERRDDVLSADVSERIYGSNVVRCEETLSTAFEEEKTDGS